MAPTEQLLYSIPKTAKLLGKSTRTIRRMIERGDLFARDMNEHGKYRILMVPHAEIERLTKTFS